MRWPRTVRVKSAAWPVGEYASLNISPPEGEHSAPSNPSTPRRSGGRFYMADQDKDKYLLGTVVRSLTLLDTVAEHQPCSLTDLVHVTGYDKSNLFRMTYTLESCGYLEKDAAGRFSLGLKPLTLSGALLANRTIATVAGPLMARVADSLNASVHLSNMSGGDAVAILVKHPLHSMRGAGHAGMTASAYLTSFGRVLLAHLSPSELDLAARAYTYRAPAGGAVHSKDDLLDVLASVRELGYSTEFNELDADYGSLSVPVFDHLGACSASVGVITLSKDIRADFDRYLSELQGLAADIQAGIGSTL